jgi:hypothetical protein
MQDNLSVLSVELLPVHGRLIAIRRKLVALAAKGGSHKSDLKPFQEELRKIDSLSICNLRLKVCAHALFLPCHRFLPFTYGNI